MGRRVEFVSTGVLRVLTALGSLLLASAVVHVSGVSGLGTFALIQAIALVGSKVAEFGLGNALILEYSRSESSDRGEIFGSAIVITAALSLPIAIICSTLCWLLGASIAASLTVLGMLPVAAASLLVSGHLKAIGASVMAPVVEVGGASMVTAAVVVAADLLHWQMTSATTCVCFTVSWATLLCVVIISSKKSFWIGLGVDRISVERLRSTAPPFLGSGLAQMVVMYGPILALGAASDPASVGTYRLAERIALLISFALVIVNTVYPKRFAECHVASLRRLVDESSRYAGVPGIIAFVFIVAFSGSILNTVDSVHPGAQSVLIALSVGQLVNALAGPAAYLLGMRGEAKLVRNVAWTVSGATLALVFPLAETSGPVAVAICVSAGLVVQNLALVALVRNRLGFWMTCGVRTSGG